MVLIADDIIATTHISSKTLRDEKTQVESNVEITFHPTTTTSCLKPVTSITPRQINICTLLEENSLAPLFSGSEWAGTRVWNSALEGVNYLVDYEIFENKDSIFFVSINGGLVYTLNDKDLFNRIDKSFDHKMQSDSSVIFEKDTIFKFGGYGFWSMRKLMTYYDSKQSEWYPKPNSEKGLDEGYSNSILLSDNDDFYILGGYKMNGLLEVLPNKKVHHFDGNNEKWTEIGKINSNVSNKDFYFVLGTDFYLINESNVQKYDVKNNSITSYKKHSLLYKSVLKKHRIIIKENQVVFVTFENNNQYLNSLPLNELLGNPLNKKRLINFLLHTTNQ